MDTTVVSLPAPLGGRNAATSQCPHMDVANWADSWCSACAVAVHVDLLTCNPDWVQEVCPDCRSARWRWYVNLRIPSHRDTVWMSVNAG